MSKYQRMPQAPSEPPSELAEFLSHFHVHFAQQRSRTTLARYLTGLLTEHPNKNCGSCFPGVDLLLFVSMREIETPAR